MSRVEIMELFTDIDDLTLYGTYTNLTREHDKVPELDKDEEEITRLKRRAGEIV